MATQLRNLIHRFIMGDHQMVMPFEDALREVRKLAKNHLPKIKALICGMTFGSSAVLPALYPADLNLRSLYLMDFGIFIVSVILFAALNGAEIALNGKYTLVAFLIIGTLVLLFQRVSLEAFAPYIPLSVAVSLLGTIYVVPWAKTSFHRNRISLGEYVIATGGGNSGGSHGAAVDTASVRSIGAFQGSLNRILRLGPDPLAFLHMDHLDRGYQTPRTRVSPENASSVDLELGLYQEAVSSTASAGTRDPFL